jgi:hypothetical protein
VRSTRKPVPPHSSSDCHTVGNEAWRRRRALLAAVFIVFNAATYFLVVYDRLRPIAGIMEQWARDVMAGRFPAPEQYRVAIPVLSLGLERVLHLRVSQSVPLIEAICFAGTLTLLYRLLRPTPSLDDPLLHVKITEFALFLAAAQLPILWIFPWERHETLPTAFFVSAIVYIVAGKTRRHWVVSLLIVTVLALGESFARADVPVVVGVALLIAAATRIEFCRPPSQVALFGIASVIVGACVQLYLQQVVFPHNTYPPNVPRIQLLENLNPTASPEHIPVFLTALLPFFVTLIVAWRRRPALLSSDKLIILTCLLYLPLWVTVGLVTEVRIFVPFLFLSSPVIARVWTAFLYDLPQRARLISE